MASRKRQKEAIERLALLAAGAQDALLQIESREAAYHVALHAAETLAAQVEQLRIQAMTPAEYEEELQGK